MKTFSLLLWVSLVLGFLSVRADEDSLWIKKADDIRNPSESFEMSVEVTTEDEESVFQCFIQGKEKTLIVTQQPARNKGRNMLMLDRDFHAYIPNLKRSMRLSLAQKLSGQVANGDISRTRWFGDYDVKLEKTMPTESQFILKAKKDNLTYANIRLWLDNKTKQPLRAEYLGSDGKTLLKKAYFEDYGPLAGALRPRLIRIVDTTQKTSLIKIKTMKEKNFPESFFSIRNMESMK